MNNTKDWNWIVELKNFNKSKFVKLKVEYSQDMSKLHLIGMIKFEKIDPFLDVVKIELNPNDIQTIEDMANKLDELIDLTFKKGDEVKRIHEIMQNIRTIELEEDEKEK